MNTNQLNVAVVAALDLEKLHVAYREAARAEADLDAQVAAVCAEHERLVRLRTAAYHAKRNAADAILRLVEKLPELVASAMEGSTNGD
jgi:predicted negative regulator of RcsB-dependent stress response